MQTIDVNTWEEFEEQLKLQNILAGGQFLFRGQESSSWPLDTTLERAGQREILFADYYRLISVVRTQIETVTRIRWDIPDVSQVEKLAREYDEFSRALTFGKFPAYGYMAYLRHHGFPSPLLDWTRTPYVAAYFAFRRAASDSVTIYVYSDRTGNFKIWSSDETQIHTLGPYIATHRQHFLQQSIYTICLAYQSGEWRFAPHEGVFARENAHQDVLWKFNIPSRERLKVLKLLDAHNLNAFSLFESDESLMETLALRQLEFKAY